MPRTAAPLLLALALAAGLAGCSADTSTADDGPAASTAPRPLSAQELTALAETRPPTGMPPATVTTEQTADALAATQPKAPAAVGQVPPDQVRSALAFTAGLVAATRADRGYLCGPVSADPLAALSTPSLQQFLADSANADSRRAVEQPITGAGNSQDCGPLTWTGPGVVLGPQTWDVAAGPDGGLTVTWEGTMGYVLVAPGGVPEPWGLDARGAYGLVRSGDGWLLDSWDGTSRGALGQAWPHDVPLPDGYLARPDKPAGDPAALKALRDAAAAWRTAPAVTATVEASSDNAALRDFKRGAAQLTSTVLTAPARGDASGSLDITENEPTDTIHLDDGETVLLEVTRQVAAKPGRRLPSPLRWTSDSETDPGDSGASYDNNPFRAVALLDAADAAAPTDCPDDGPAAASCYTAAVVTADPSVPLAVLFADDAHRTGTPFTVLTVGLDEQGRPAFVSTVQESRAFGAPVSVLFGETAFAGYTDTPPPPVEVPDPATVAPADEVDFS